MKRLLLIAVSLSLAGCATLGRGCQSASIGGDLTEKARHAANHAADSAASIGGLGNIALAFVLLGGLALVASFVPVASTFVPRKAAVASLVLGLSIYFTAAFYAGFMAKFGDAVYWGIFASLIITGACALWPVLVAAHRGTLWMKARELLAAGHVAEAAAFQITATPGASKSKSIRKAILATVKKKADANG